MLIFQSPQENEKMGPERRYKEAVKSLLHDKEKAHSRLIALGFVHPRPIQMCSRWTVVTP
jgi:hypothetical protein